MPKLWPKRRSSQAFNRRPLPIWIRIRKCLQQWRKKVNLIIATAHTHTDIYTTFLKSVFIYQCTVNCAIISSDSSEGEGREHGQTESVGRWVQSGITTITMENQKQQHHQQQSCNHHRQRLLLLIIIISGIKINFISTKHTDGRIDNPPRGVLDTSAPLWLQFLRAVDVCERVCVSVWLGFYLHYLYVLHIRVTKGKHLFWQKQEQQ